MRNDLLFAHAGDLVDTGERLFGVNVVKDPFISTLERELPSHHLRIEMGKLGGASEVAVGTTEQRASREFPLFDCMMAQTNAGDIVRLELRADGLWNIVNHEGASTWGADEAVLFSLVKPLEVAQ